MEYLDLDVKNKALVSKSALRMHLVGSHFPSSHNFHKPSIFSSTFHLLIIFVFNWWWSRMLFLFWHIIKHIYIHIFHTNYSLGNINLVNLKKIISIWRTSTKLLYHWFIIHSFLLFSLLWMKILLNVHDIWRAMYLNCW